MLRGRGGARRCAGRAGAAAEGNAAAAASSPPASSSAPPPPDVAALAELAHIAVTPEEQDAWAPQIGGIAAWLDRLRDADLEGVPPALGVPDNAGNVLRADAPEAFAAQPDIVKLMPDVDAPYLRVPKVLGEVVEEEPEGEAEAAAPKAAAAEPSPELQGLDIRVGRIIKAWRHPEADKLYVEEVDIGEDEPRQICSGLVPYVPEDELQGRLVIVLANLKERNMVGVKSFGMLLAASTEANDGRVVELITPPEDAAVGERVNFGAMDAPQVKPFAVNKVNKKKVWEAVQPDMGTTGDRVVAWSGLPMVTSAGPVTAKTLANGSVG